MSHLNPFRKTVGFYEVMATSYTSGNGDHYTSAKPMESVTSKTSQRTEHGMKATSGKSSPKGVNHVNFDPKDKQVEKREKYLTAKYGAHQMLLIKKRLAVEMWIFEELGRLYCTESFNESRKRSFEDCEECPQGDESRSMPANT
ncbi:hypothetical protein BaRGS_00028420 [Batillaria attramentaria]|uniref:Uncharacterized protein n=1 Tax=Batillaria attramentaria TaxID=370345 RepID=A0ABD0K0N1_9CAEN